jgi:hypothetical protein
MQDEHLLPLEICWLQGFKSSSMGHDEGNNPYPKHSNAAYYWQEGWWECFFKEGELA